MKPSHPRRISAILWTINLSAIAASVFSYVYLSYFVYQRTNSVLLSELVLIAPMVIPVLLCLVINRIAGLTAPRKILTVFNGMGVAASLLTYFWIDAYIFVAVVGALAIGFLDAVQRVARTVAIKRYFSTAELKYAVPITLTAQFIAGGVAGVGLAFYRSEVTPAIASMIVTSAFALAAFAGWLLPREQQDSASTAPATGNAGSNAFATLGGLLAKDPALRRHFFAFVIFVSVFQGFFNVSRVTLPTHVLKLSQNFVGYLQIVSAMSALAGALLFVWLGKRKFVFGRAAVIALSMLSLGAMVGATVPGNVTTSYFLYFVYMFVWEILFFKYQADLVAVTSQEHMALVATFQYAGVYLGMIVTASLGGLITQYFGLMAAALAFVAAYAVFMPLNALRGSRLTCAPEGSA